jgi:hypothetical protein
MSTSSVALTTLRSACPSVDETTTISATSAESIVASSNSRTDERNSAPCIARIDCDRNSRCPCLRRWVVNAFKTRAVLATGISMTQRARASVSASWMAAIARLALATQPPAAKAARARGSALRGRPDSRLV